MISIIVIYVVILALVAVLPEVLDIWLSYRARKQVYNKLIEEASVDKLTFTELQEFLKIVGKPPSGIPGLTRGVIAMTVIVILGIAVFHVLIEGVPAEENQIINLLIFLLFSIIDVFFLHTFFVRPGLRHRRMFAQLSGHIVLDDQKNLH